MALPAGYEASDFVPDPSGRANHAYCPETDEVFHLAPEDYAMVANQQPAPPKPVRKGRKAQLDAVSAENSAALAAITAPTLSEGETHTPDELRQMAEDLGLTVPENATEEELLKLIQDSIAGESANHASE